MGTQKTLLVKGKIDQNLRYPRVFFLTHSQLSSHFSRGLSEDQLDLIVTQRSAFHKDPERRIGKRSHGGENGKALLLYVVVLVLVVAVVLVVVGGGGGVLLHLFLLGGAGGGGGGSGLPLLLQSGPEILVLKN